MMQVHALASRRARTTGAVRAAIYARVSSDQQADRHTIDSQVEALLARAAADGHEIQAELRFLDDGQSGASLIRPALERLRDLAAMGVIDVVYVHAPDRLARSYAHQAVLIEEFARAGAGVVFLNRPIGQTPGDPRGEVLVVGTADARTAHLFREDLELTYDPAPLTAEVRRVAEGYRV